VTNFLLFLSPAIHDILIEHEKEKWATSQSISTANRDLVTEVMSSFGPLLQRKREIDKMKKQMRIIALYNHIFNIPPNIKLHIQQVPSNTTTTTFGLLTLLFFILQKGKYENIVSDYKKLALLEVIFFALPFFFLSY
jgi:hypothetical protein